MDYKRDLSDKHSVIRGTGRSDTLYGSSRDETLYGAGADDTVYAGGGNDVLYGGNQSDILYGGDGGDAFFGGNNFLRSDVESMRVDATDLSSDTFYGGKGDDRAFMTATIADTFFGGEGNDFVAVNSARHSIDFGTGDQDKLGLLANITLNDMDVRGLDVIDLQNALGTFDLKVTGTDNLSHILGNNTLKIINSNVIGSGDGYVYLDGFNKISSGSGDNAFDTYQLNGITVHVQSEIIVVTDGKEIVRHVINGSQGDDTLTGTSIAETIYGYGGDDTIFGGDGSGTDDIIKAGDGNDLVYGGAGDDDITGDAGHDVLYGGTGKDAVYGFNDDDILFGGAGDDAVLGGAGNDTLFGGAGNDVLFAGWSLDPNGDTLFGGTGSDVMYADTGNNTFFGGELRLVFDHTDTESDTFYGGTGTDTAFLTGYDTDTMFAGDGNDYIFTNSTRHVIDFGTGNADKLALLGDYTLNGAPVSGVNMIDLHNAAGQDHVLTINEISGLSHSLDSDKTLMITDLYGHGGVNGTVNLATEFNRGDLISLQGDLWNTYTLADVTIYIHQDVTVNHIQGGGSVINGGDSYDYLVGTSGLDTIYGYGGMDTLSGLAGHDTLFGGTGDDTLFGGSGSDVLQGGSGNDTFFGGDHRSVFDQSDMQSDTFYGGEGTDIAFLTDRYATDTMFGGSGNDYIFTDHERHQINFGSHVSGFGLNDADILGLLGQSDTHTYDLNAARVTGVNVIDMHNDINQSGHTLSIDAGFGLHQKIDNGTLVITDLYAGGGINGQVSLSGFIQGGKITAQDQNTPEELNGLLINGAEFDVYTGSGITLYIADDLTVTTA